jgi:hypothetical protein
MLGQRLLVQERGAVNRAVATFRLRRELPGSLSFSLRHVVWGCPDLNRVTESRHSHHSDDLGCRNNCGINSHIDRVPFDAYK